MNLPPELREEMGWQEKPDQPYNAHDYVLCYIAEHDGSTSNDLLIYLWATMGKITSRNYLYHMLGRLRRRGLIHTNNEVRPSVHFITVKGLKEARPFVDVPLPTEDDDDDE